MNAQPSNTGAGRHIGEHEQVADPNVASATIGLAAVTAMVRCWARTNQHEKAMPWLTRRPVSRVAFGRLDRW
jgi:hypothetical protein